MLAQRYLEEISSAAMLTAKNSGVVAVQTNSNPKCHQDLSKFLFSAGGWGGEGGMGGEVWSRQFKCQHLSKFSFSKRGRGERGSPDQHS